MSDDGLQFEEVETIVPEDRLLPTLDPKRRVQAMGTIQQDDLHIFLREEILREIIIYSKSNTSRELGGVLIGDFYKWKMTYWIEIVGYVKAVRYENTSASFKFTLASLFKRSFSSTLFSLIWRRMINRKRKQRKEIFIGKENTYAC